jgi:metal-responsive CopG/Arc/MetJ family transcriptional regulator
MKTAISIPDTLFVAAERLAKQLGISRSELFAKAVKGFLAKNGQVGVTEQLNAIYAAPEDNDGLESELHSMQSKSLGEDSW